jgi:hypothetical protein
VRRVRNLLPLALAACSSAPPAAPATGPASGGPPAPAAAPDAAVAAAPDAAPPRELAYPPTPFTEPRTAKVGKVEVRVTPCRLDVPIEPDPPRKGRAGGLAVDTEGRIYHLRADATLRRFTLAEPCDLRLDESFAPITVAARDDVESLSVDSAGVFYVSRFNEKPLRIEPSGKQEEICGYTDVVRTEPGAKATIVDGRRVETLAGECEGPELQLEGWKGSTPESSWPFAGDVAFVNYVGDSVPIDYHRVFIHSLDGKKKVWVGSGKDGPQKICGAKVVWPCGERVCLGDWGCSALRVWNLDGKFVGAVESPELVGIVDARPIDAVEVGGASLLLLAASVEDGDGWLTYPLIVRIDGLN